VAGEREGEFFVLGADPKLPRAFSPAANHATSSSRVSIGVISTWSRAMQYYNRGGGARPYTWITKEQLEGRRA